MPGTPGQYFAEAAPEAWMRGPLEGVNPLLAPVLFSFQQAREELRRHTAALTIEELWSRPGGLASAGFHLRHIAGSVRRLTAYLQGRPLTAQEFEELAKESAPGESAEVLLANLEFSLTNAEAIIRAVDPATLSDVRTVGRRLLPTTVIGLLVHLAEHTQRHVGQAISAAKLARAVRANGQALDRL